MLKLKILLILLPVTLVVLALPFAYSQEKEEGGAGDHQQKISMLIQKLGAETYQEREEAYESLKALGEEVRPYLKKALESDEVEIRWRASRLLSYLDGKKVDRQEGNSGGEWDAFPGFSSLMERMKQLSESLDRWDGPGGPDDPLSKDSPFFGFRFFDNDPFGDMKQLMEKMGQNMGGLNIDVSGGQARYHIRRQEGGMTEECTLEIQEDGSVTATLKTVDGKGDVQEKRYEAESMEAFRKEFPEIAKKFDGHGVRFSLNGSWEGTKRQADGSPFGLRRRGSDPREGKNPPKTLGIYINPKGPDEVLRSQLGLGDGVGIIIEKVLPDTFAETIGLQPRDILVSVAGREVGRAQDVGTALDKVNVGEETTVEVIREGKKITLSGTFGVSAKQRL